MDRALAVLGLDFPVRPCWKVPNLPFRYRHIKQKQATWDPTLNPNPGTTPVNKFFPLLMKPPRVPKVPSEESTLPIPNSPSMPIQSYSPAEENKDHKTCNSAVSTTGSAAVSTAAVSLKADDDDGDYSIEEEEDDDVDSSSDSELDDDEDCVYAEEEAAAEIDMTTNPTGSSAVRDG
eukprot:Protomagalhaensia_wolfi_Nauph_80__1640@NODE_2010_length_1245_cov_4_441128_g1572_i0_p2_GENE_NODE_2010_length_1245_cov_4_441128_g1572_i0NODE_2010_length_1245_cov_4_441128_g1572_i0_p2_ORF_typecomplete_len177_score47_09YL1/PF05764_13/0_13RNA_pol_3_Rpc31/PF11705_8/5_NODE_2010_length_1245_cov_4_441128_g1572_i0105635